MRIYLCRHGRRGPDGPEREKTALLSLEGHDQARRLGRWLADQPVAPEVILASPKIRAIQTARPLADYLGLPIVVWPSLIEHNSYGPKDYLEEEIKAYGGILDLTMLLPDTPEREEKPFAYKRALASMARLRDWGEETFAVFAHDCFNSIFLWAWLGRGCLKEEDRYRQEEACVNILDDKSAPLINLKVAHI